ncbi:stereocilin [Struthio camelus]|uniref:stereocilin n=1 Tax=Struthio camelus TaxID=8801 RepID=UPI003603F939
MPQDPVSFLESRDSLCLSSAALAALQARARQPAEMPAPVQSPLAGLEALGVPPAAGARPAQTPRGARQGEDGLPSFLHSTSRLPGRPERAGEPGGPVRHPPRATLLRLQRLLLSLRGGRRWGTLLGLLSGPWSLSGAERPPAPRPRCQLLGSLARARGPRGARPQSPRCALAGPGGGGGPSGLARLLAPLQPGAPRDGHPAGPRAPQPEPSRAPAGEAGAEEPGGVARQRPARAAGRRPSGRFWRRVSRVRGALVQEASLALGVPRLDGDGRCSAGTLPQLLLWGFRHNVSWDLGFPARALPAPPPLAGCLQPVPRRAAAPQAEPSLLPPVLEAACNRSVPGLPGVSNFTIYLYCNLFNSSRGSSQRPGDLGVACSDADWYLSGGSAWALLCREHFPARFNATVCSNVSLRETPGPQQLLLEELCAGPPGPQPPGRGACPPGARWEDAWSCFLGSGRLWSAWGCGPAVLPRPPGPPAGAEPCSAGAPSPRASASPSEPCGAPSPGSAREPACAARPPGRPQPGVQEHCRGARPGGRCLLQQLLALLPLPAERDGAGLCPHPGAYLLGLASQLARCRQVPAWVAHVNYLLRLLDSVLALCELDEAGRAARRQLHDAVLLSSLLNGSSSWAGAAGGVLRAVGRYLQRGREASAKQELLSCFSAMLWDLLQEEEGTPALGILLQEYLQMPPERLRQLLLSADSEAVQRFLALLHRSWLTAALQVLPSREEALQSLASLLLRRFSHLTPQLFVDLSQFLPFMAVSDIMRFPPDLLANETVLAALQTHSTQLMPGQKAAFARRLLQAPFLGAVPTWPLSFLRAALPLLPHLPLSCFLQLTPQQIWGLGDGWQLLPLGLAQGHHVARSLVNGSREAGPAAAQRLGTLACFLSPEELQELAALQDPRGPVEQSLLACAAAGTLQQHGRVMLALADLLRSTSLAAMGPGELPAWRGVLPEMGVGFLERLSAAQLDALLPALQPAQLTRAQVTAGDAGRLCPLLPGLSPRSLAAVLALLRRRGCACLGPALPLLSAAQTAALLQALQGPRREQPPDGWPDCLLPLVPLQLLRPGAQALQGAPRAPHLPWSPQQAQLLWREVGASANRSHRATGALGSLVVGMSCAALQELGREDFLGALGTLYARPRALPASLRRCVQEEALRRPPLAREELARLGPEFLMELPAKLLETLPGPALRPALAHARRRPRSLLALPPARRAALARGALRALSRGAAPAGPPRGPPPLPAEALDALGPLVGFLGRESAARLAPESLLPRLAELQATCVAAEAAEELGRLLLAEGALGPPPRWRPPALQQLGRLVFLLPAGSLRAVPRDLLSRAAVERLLQSQRDWDGSELGRLCRPPGPGPGPQLEALVAPLVGATGPGHRAPVPSCADVRATFPAAWSAAQLAAMDPAQLRPCLGLLSTDPALRPDQLRAVLGQARRLLGSGQAPQAAASLLLGRLATQLGEPELRQLALPDWGALSALGELDGWSGRQTRAVVSGFLRQRGASARDLLLPELVALGHLLCGLRAAELRSLDAGELSKAAPFLGSLSLRCSEQQMEALAARLTSSAAFGPAGAWGPEIFTEIGTLAAGLPDVVLSALVPEQIWALTPQAVAAIPAPKLAVVFGPAQLRTLSSAQASAVTPEQRRRLSSAQRRALAGALWEGAAAQEGQGRSGASSQSGFTWALLLCLPRRVL